MCSSTASGRVGSDQVGHGRDCRTADDGWTTDAADPALPPRGRIRQAAPRQALHRAANARPRARRTEPIAAPSTSGSTTRTTMKCFCAAGRPRSTSSAAAFSGSGSDGAACGQRKPIATPRSAAGRGAVPSRGDPRSFAVDPASRIPSSCAAPDIPPFYYRPDRRPGTAPAPRWLQRHRYALRPADRPPPPGTRVAHRAIDDVACRLLRVARLREGTIGAITSTYGLRVPLSRILLTLGASAGLSPRSRPCSPAATASACCAPATRVPQSRCGRSAMNPSRSIAGLSGAFRLGADQVAAVPNPAARPDRRGVSGGTPPARSCPAKPAAVAAACRRAARS